MLNPFEYFYQSSLDSAMGNFRSLIQESYSLMLVKPDPEVNITKPEAKKFILGDISLGVPYISCLVYLLNNESQFLQNLYQTHIGEYISQNHFISENEYIKPCESIEYNYSFAFDMLLKYLKLTENLPIGKFNTLFKPQSVFLELNAINFYNEPNIHHMELEIDKIGLSISEDHFKSQVCKVDQLLVDNISGKPSVQEPEEEVKNNPMANNSPLKGYFRVDRCFTIDEEEAEEYEDGLMNKIEELDVIFNKKKSVELNSANDKGKPKKNFVNVEFKKGIQFAMTHQNLMDFTQILESVNKHVASIKTIFYTSRRCLLEVTGCERVLEKAEPVKSPEKTSAVEIDSVFEDIDAPDKGQDNLVPHRLLFKLHVE